MDEYKKRKLLFDWDPDVLKEKMLNLGLSVEFIDKPETLDDMRCKYGNYILKPEYLDDKSYEKIQKYLEDKGADGGLIVGKDEWSIPTSDVHDIIAGRITIQPFKLIYIKKS